MHDYIGKSSKDSGIIKDTKPNQNGKVSSDAEKLLILLHNYLRVRPTQTDANGTVCRHM